MAKRYYRWMLPHLVPPGALLFITFRLANSLPQTVLAELKEARLLARQQLAAQFSSPDEQQAAQIMLHKRLFARLDAALDRCQDGARWLQQSRIAAIVAAKILRLAKRSAAIHSFCIMPNHVHLLVQWPEDESFSF